MTDKTIMTARELGGLLTDDTAHNMGHVPVELFSYRRWRTQPVFGMRFSAESELRVLDRVMHRKGYHPLRLEKCPATEFQSELTKYLEAADSRLMNTPVSYVDFNDPAKWVAQVIERLEASDRKTWEHAQEGARQQVRQMKTKIDNLRADAEEMKAKLGRVESLIATLSDDDSGDSLGKMFKEFGNRLEGVLNGDVDPSYGFGHYSE